MNRMNFNDFKNKVAEKIKDFLPETFSDADVSLQCIIKNNDLKVTGLTIKKQSKNIAPTIYLESFFSRYENGAEFYSILKEIADERIKYESKENFDTSLITDFSKCSHLIIPRLVNKELNSSLLSQRPYTPLADLAVIYCISLGTTEDCSISVPITNNLMLSWNISTEELHNLAVANLPSIEKSSFQSMNEVMRKLILPEISKEFDGDIEKAEESISNMIPDNLMFILSNEKKTNGAAALLDNSIMQKVIEEIGDSFYILPSSIHEIIIVPNSLNIMDVAALREMVEEVNLSQVSPAERLSDNVYIYTDAGIQIAE